MPIPDRPDDSVASGERDVAELLSRLAEGEAAAFEELFERSFDRLRRVAYGYLRSWTDAEDLVHDVFLTLWRRHRWLGGVRDLDAYLSQITRNHALNFLKRRRVETRWREREAAAADAEPELAPDPERAVLSAERVAAILEAVDGLAPRQREVMLLRWREGKGVEEIAARLGIAAKTVEIHVTRAHKQLRKALASLLSL